MAVVESRIELDASIEDVFAFIANPKNIESVYPKDMSFKVIDMPERIDNGAVVTMSALLMGQLFTWRTIIKDFNRPYSFVDEAIDSPFRYWRHRHIIHSINGKCVMEDRIEFSTVLGYIGDRSAKRMISNILEYRNTMISNIFNKSTSNGNGIEESIAEAESRYSKNNPTRISIIKGTTLSVLMIVIALALPLVLKGSLLIELLVGFVSWLLLWFFTHDIAHLAVGRIVGIRFSHYYIGLSNLTRALPLKPKYRLLFIALGIKIDRSKSNVSKRAYAAMYLAGPIATMLSPFYVPLLYLSSNYSKDVALVLLILSALNLVSDTILSSKHGCIRKGVRALTRP